MEDTIMQDTRLPVAQSYVSISREEAEEKLNNPRRPLAGSDLVLVAEHFSDLSLIKQHNKTCKDGREVDEAAMANRVVDALMTFGAEHDEKDVTKLTYYYNLQRAFNLSSYTQDGPAPAEAALSKARMAWDLLVLRPKFASVPLPHPEAVLRNALHPLDVPDNEEPPVVPEEPKPEPVSARPQGVPPSTSSARTGGYYLPNPSPYLHQPQLPGQPSLPAHMPMPHRQGLSQLTYPPQSLYPASHQLPPPPPVNNSRPSEPNNDLSFLPIPGTITYEQYCGRFRQSRPPIGYAPQSSITNRPQQPGYRTQRQQASLHQPGMYHPGMHQAGLQQLVPHQSVPQHPYYGPQHLYFHPRLPPNQQASPQQPHPQQFGMQQPHPQQLGLQQPVHGLQHQHPPPAFYPHQQPGMHQAGMQNQVHDHTPTTFYPIGFQPNQPGRPVPVAAWTLPPNFADFYDNVVLRNGTHRRLPWRRYGGRSRRRR